MLVKGQIFARMSPDEKHELVELLQGIGYCVGFCGDGANDCGALKAADVGISLSEAEASVAAPFTSRTNDIGCVVSVIKEGRAALVTSFSCFKFMALYSIIQFTTVSFLYAFASNLGDFQFLYIDLALILPIAVFMGRTEAFPVLNPKRPTANLVSKKVLTSLIGHILIQFAFQGIVFWAVRRQEWYKPPVYHRGEKNIECFENTAMFLLSCFQYLLVAVVFSVGPPYRKPMVSNRKFFYCFCTYQTLVFILRLSCERHYLREILYLRSFCIYYRWLGDPLCVDGPVPSAVGGSSDAVAYHPIQFQTVYPLYGWMPLGPGHAVRAACVPTFGRIDRVMDGSQISERGRRSCQEILR